MIHKNDEFILLTFHLLVYLELLMDVWLDERGGLGAISLNGYIMFSFFPLHFNAEVLIAFLMAL